MAVFDMARKAIVLKIVYYGCALGGKTTNLVTLHRLTDPESRHGLVSIATRDDRTLFFDLLPMELGQIGGLQVRAKVYTVPGQVHYELTRRQVLAGADGVVLVVDSSPDCAKANRWALENLDANLKANGLDPATTPRVFQWNKRDLPDARPVAELEKELNPRGLPAFEAVATTGAGVVDTFAAALKAAIRHAYVKAGKEPVSDEVLAQTVDPALEDAKAREPELPDKSDPKAAGSAFDHRFDSVGYQKDWADRGRDRKIVDQETLLSEAVQTGMELAERLDGLNQVQEQAEVRAQMVRALAAVQKRASVPSEDVVNAGDLRAVLKALKRKRLSVMFLRQGVQSMVEKMVLPGPPDPLNALEAPAVGTAAHRLCRTQECRFVEDLRGEVFFDAVPPEAEDLVSCWIAPMVCDGTQFGALVAYVGMDEGPMEEVERDFWQALAGAYALAFHWRALRKKLAGAAARAS